MTSDAKIGLLLGLIFIFVIAFIINGLPRFQAATNTNNSELTTTMVSSQNGTLGIGGNERHMQERFDWSTASDTPPQPAVQMSIEQKEDIRFTMKLPPEPPAVQEPLITKSSIAEPAIDQVAKEAEPAPQQPAEQAAPAQPAGEKGKTRKAKSHKPAPSTPSLEYVVAEGDTLGGIAKKLYGTEEGNKLTSITRIFEANRQILKSPNDITVGQKLTIPPVEAPVANDKKTESATSLPGEIFEKAVAIGKNLLKGDEPSESPKAKPARQTRAAVVAPYVVQDGDSLSRIASKQLGDSSRYLEIAKLNGLKDPDSLTVGTQLKMPVR